MFCLLITMSMLMMKACEASAALSPAVSSAKAPGVPTRASCSLAVWPWSEKVISSRPFFAAVPRNSGYLNMRPLVTVCTLG